MSILEYRNSNFTYNLQSHNYEDRKIIKKQIKQIDLRRKLIIERKKTIEIFFQFQTFSLVSKSLYNLDAKDMQFRFHYKPRLNSEWIIQEFAASP